ncbi:hypothetical protein C1645_819225 [Glomus cerebriforme]|uniref:Uncharacterized protein n=1 Tax=Glomus cerebriforme TaxID=658196 RepID=A0A397T6X2_9GLOM|nr:hypothetical protein C1645_819225 [Glomus cerebriforme]
MSNTPFNDSLRELNTKFLVEIAKLRKKFAEIEGKNGELKNENVKLRRIIEENGRRDAKNAEHKIRIEELEKNSADISAENAELKAELTKLRHDFDSSNLTRPLQSQHVTNVQNSCFVGEEEISKVTTVPQPGASDPVKDQPINGTPSDNTNIKLMEERKTDTFLAIQDSSSIMKDKKSQSHKKREAENIVQDAFDFTATSAPEKNHVTKISMTGNPLPVTENTDEKNSVVMLSVAKSKPLLNLACLYQKACDAEKQRIRANKDEILCWYHYVIEFDNQRARSIYKLFERIGIDKIKYITTYNANSISELSDSQIQTIVDYFSKNSNTELLGDQDDSIIDSKKEISDDQTNASEAVSAEVNISTVPIPVSYDLNSSGSVNADDGNPNLINDDSDSNNSEEEIPDDSDNDGYNGYDRYNEYGECD